MILAYHFNSNTEFSFRMNVKLEELERERLTGISDPTPNRFDNLRQRKPKQRTFAAQLTQGPQFESKPLLPENINSYFGRFRSPEDRSGLRAKIAQRNAALAPAQSRLAQTQAPSSPVQQTSPQFLRQPSARFTLTTQPRTPVQSAPNFNVHQLLF